MENETNNSFQAFQHKLKIFLSSHELIALGNLANKICKEGWPDATGRPKCLAKIFDIAAEASCKVSNDVEQTQLQDAVSCLVMELASRKVLSILEFFSSLKHFLENMKFSIIPKASQDVSEKINRILTKNLSYGIILRILLKSFTKNASNADLETNFNQTKNALLDVVLLLVRILQIPRSAEYKDICIFDNENMKIYGFVVENGLEALHDMLSFGGNCEYRNHLTNSDLQKIVHFVIKKSAAEVVFLTLGNLGNHAWTSKGSNKQAEMILKFICKAANAKGLEPLLVGEERAAGKEQADRQMMFPSGLLGQLLDEIRSRFGNDGWKQDPTVKHVLLHTCMNVKYPHLKKHISILVSMLIDMIEDYKCENQILGIGCLEYLIDNVNASDLNLYNHGALLYDVLFKQLYGAKHATLRVLLPCLLKVLYVIEAFPERINTQINKWDKTVSQLITNMDYESKLTVRRVLAENLKCYVSALGINCVKHLKNLLRLTSHYLEFHDGEDEEVRINSLEILKACVINCWPIVSRHLSDILKGLLRLVVDINIKGSFTSESARQSLQDLALEIVALLKQCCEPGLVNEYLKAALDADVDKTFHAVKDFIRMALEREVLNEFITK